MTEKIDKYKGVLAYFIGFLIEDARDAKKKALNTSNKEEEIFQGGRALAYFEVLTSLKNRLDSLDIQLKDVNYTINPDLEFKDFFNRRKK